MSDMSLPDCLVEGGTEELTAVFTATDTCYSFTVGAFKPPQTLTALDLPHLHTHTYINKHNVLVDVLLF